MKRALAITLLLFLLEGVSHAQLPRYDQILRGSIPPRTAKPPAETRYRFVAVYTNFTDQGTLAGPKATVAGDFIFRYDDGTVRWSTATETTSDGEKSSVAPQRYMQDLTYTRADRDKVFSPEFLRLFPQNSEKVRNLVWDQVMFDSFLDYLDKLKLSQPIKGPAGPVRLGGNDYFYNHDIELTWTGITRRNGEDCLVIHYDAFQNRFEINAGNVLVKARSDYWGDMWVSVRTRQIEMGTLFEEVAGTVQIAQQRIPLLVFRRATLEAIR